MAVLIARYSLGRTNGRTVAMTTVLYFILVATNKTANLISSQDW